MKQIQFRFVENENEAVQFYGKIVRRLYESFSLFQTTREIHASRSFNRIHFPNATLGTIFIYIYQHGQLKVGHDINKDYMQAY